MRKILILTACFGNGHNAAATGLRDALLDSSQDVHVEVLDLIKLCYGARSELAKRVFLGIVNHTPRVWACAYRAIDRTSIMARFLRRLRKLRQELFRILVTTEPDVVVSTYPAYNYVIDQIYESVRDRRFQKVTVVTDSISVNSIWHGSPSDYYFVPNDLSAQVLHDAGVPRTTTFACGFPVSPWFYELAQTQATPVAARGEPKRILYVIQDGNRATGQTIEKLLALPEVELTLVCGANPKLERRLNRRVAHAGKRARVFGWTNRMPELLATHHLVIAKAGGALVQEAIAARCPMIVNRIIPGQEEGNAKLVASLGIGAVAARGDDVAGLVHNAFADDARLWHFWKSAITRHSRPDAALHIARTILEKADKADASLRPGPASPESAAGSPAAVSFPAVLQPRKPLLCDFHAHSTYSDGDLTIRELVDFYGQRRFDCLCVTDHVAEMGSLIGRVANMTGLTMRWNRVEEYFDVLSREKQRAWAKYGMVLLAGMEFNKDGISKHSSAHLLALDLQTPIRPDAPIRLIIRAIQQQRGLAVAAHPHVMKGRWDRDTLYLWERQDEFAGLLDAWEIANRDDIFNPVGLQRLPYIANSDFHKPKHIYSWKTLLNCEKHPDAIKQCIRDNRDISITLFRDGDAPAASRTAEHGIFAGPAPAFQIHGGQLQLPFAV
jgi:UDP-N-acetylglucosamine:LPS N-acetylglucosamine transferase